MFPEREQWLSRKSAPKRLSSARLPVHRFLFSLPVWPCLDTGMLIVAGWLQVQADQRGTYLAVANEASRHARASTGCLEFVQAADPLSPGRIIDFERWESAGDLDAFRASGSGQEPVVLPEVLDADVKRYLISAVEPA